MLNYLVVLILYYYFVALRFEKLKFFDMKIVENIEYKGFTIEKCIFLDGFLYRVLLPSGYYSMFSIDKVKSQITRFIKNQKN